jgi:hypothetical protein
MNLVQLIVNYVDKEQLALLFDLKTKKVGNIKAKNCRKSILRKN